MHIVILGDSTVTNGDLSFSDFSRFGTVSCYDILLEEDICTAVREAEAILVNRSLITKRVIAAAPRLRYIGSLATGYNNIDLSAAAAAGVTVTNIPAYSTEAVAVHTMGLLLQCCLHLAEYDRHVRTGGWQYGGVDCFPYATHELAGKTLGIYGLGTIGRRVAELAQPFGLQIIFYSRSNKQLPGARQVDFDALLAQSDFLSLHAPLAENNHGIFNADAFARMKPTAYLLNTARGGLIDENALRTALETGEIAGAALDVTADEPLEKKPPLFDAPHCFFTPHVAWAPVETRARLLRIAAENLEAFLAGTPKHIVEV